MDITFTCEKCGQHIAVDEAGAGQLVDCPKCKELLEVPYKSKPLTGEERAHLRTVTASPHAQVNIVTEPPATTSNLTRCPDCTREISKRAAACPHCGAPIAGAMPTTDEHGAIHFGTPRQAPVPFRPVSAGPIPVNKSEKKINPIRIVLMVVAIGFIVVGLADSTFFYVGFGVVLLFLAAIAK